MAQKVLEQLETLNGSLIELNTNLMNIHKTLMRNSDVLIETLSDVNRELTFISNRMKR